MVIGYRVDRSILRWFGLMNRIGAISRTRKVMNDSIDGRAPGRRPRFGWMNGVSKC